jgi:hypothetical protein
MGEAPPDKQAASETGDDEAAEHSDEDGIVAEDAGAAP